MISEGVIVQHIRKGNRVVGTLVGINTDFHPVDKVTPFSTFNIGYSLCNSKDKFNKNHGTEIAYGRATKNPVIKADTLPTSIRKNYIDFYKRCCRYFKRSPVSF